MQGSGRVFRSNRGVKDENVESPKAAARRTQGPRAGYDAAPAESDCTPMNTDTLDESSSPAKKRDYFWMLDFVAAAAAGQFFSKWLVFHDGPSVSGLLAGLSYLTGGGIGYVLCYYLRTQFTKNLQTRGAVIFASILISLGLVLAIITARVLFTKPAGKFDAASAVPIVDPFDQKTAIDLAPTDATAQTNLGLLYFEGKGVPQDHVKGVLWLQAAGNQGYARAQYNLGSMYYHGTGLPKDYMQAFQWYRKAADQGFNLAQSSLGWMYNQGQGVPQDYTEAIQWYRKAADQGLAESQLLLGSMYFNGQGVPQDYAQAAQWYRKAADQGDAMAQNNLGSMYYHGKGLPKNYMQALQWTRKSAEQGLNWAQSSLGSMYFNGQGAPKDYGQAVQWFILAKASGNKEADHNLALAESKATPAQIAEAQKLARDWWSAHHPGQ